MCWKLELIHALLIISITSVLWTKHFVYGVVMRPLRSITLSTDIVNISNRLAKVFLSQQLRDVQVQCATSYWWTTLQFYLLAVFSVMSSSEFLESQKRMVAVNDIEIVDNKMQASNPVRVNGFPCGNRAENIL
jgi:hypothetical protein